MDLESSGLTPIDVAFLQSVVTNASLPKNVDSEVYLVTATENEFITCYLERMEETKEGRFQRSKTSGSLTLKTFLCERHEKPRGKSQGNPSKTRANSCKSYVSFKFVGDGIRKACLVRKNVKHSGHCLDNRQEWKVNRIHPSLVNFIIKLSREGHKREEIVTKVKGWALKNQAANCTDRRFHPTLQDIRYLMSRVEKKEKDDDAEGAHTAKKMPELEFLEDGDSENTDSISETSPKILGVGIKCKSEDAESSKYIVLRKQTYLSHRCQQELVDSERLATTIEPEEPEEPTHVKTVISTASVREDATVSTLNLMSSRISIIPEASTSNMFASNVQASQEDLPTSPSFPDILLSLSSRQILPSVPEDLISNNNPNILAISPSPKTLTATPTSMHEQTQTLEKAKVGDSLSAESAQSNIDLPHPVTEIPVSCTETTSSQILLPQFVKITSPVKLISTSSDNGQILSSKRYPSSNIIAGNFTNESTSITMTTDETLPISLDEISPSTVTISLSKGDSSLSTVGLTLSSDGLLLTSNGVPLTTESILTANQEIGTPGKYAEGINSTDPLPIYTLHYNSLRDDPGTISGSNSKPADQNSETNLEENISNSEENNPNIKSEVLDQILHSSSPSLKEDLQKEDCLQRSPRNLSCYKENDLTENSSELSFTTEEPNFEKNTQPENIQIKLELEKREECNTKDKVLIPDNETSKTSCLVPAKNDQNSKLPSTKKQTCQNVENLSGNDSHQSESSQSNESEQRPKKKLNSHTKRRKSNSLLEQPLKKRKILSSIKPTTSDTCKEKGTPINNHLQLKKDNISEKKKVFSYTTPLLLYNISQGRLQRLGITEDEMRRRTSAPEKLNLRALQALLQTHKKKQWKQNLKTKMVDASIAVNEGQSGHLTAFTRLSEEEASHLEFELLKMVANPNHVKINNIVQELVTEAIPDIEIEKDKQAKNYLKNLQVTRQTLGEIYQKFVLHSENFSLITHTFGTSCMDVMKSVFDDILEKTMQRTMEEIANAQS